MAVWHTRVHREEDVKTAEKGSNNTLCRIVVGNDLRSWLDCWWLSRVVHRGWVVSVLTSATSRVEYISNSATDRDSTLPMCRVACRHFGWNRGSWRMDGRLMAGDRTGAIVVRWPDDAAAMSAPTSPPTSRRYKGKVIDCNVRLLDDTVHTVRLPVSTTAMGRLL